jgi:hypothetical protein
LGFLQAFWFAFGAFFDLFFGTGWLT